MFESGAQGASGAIAKRVQVRNVGLEPVRIDVVPPQADAMSVTCMPAGGRKISPGTALTITVTFRPSATMTEENQVRGLSIVACTVTSHHELLDACPHAYCATFESLLLI